MGIHVFAGPTIGPREINEVLPEARVHPPVGHGDLFRLDLAAGDVVLVIDGVFHHHAPLRHKEILHMVAAGVRMVGASSMGALRAAELHPYGMAGIGKVFQLYRDGVIEADDEVAVVHTEAPDWRQLSEALVNIRHTVEMCQAPTEILELARGIPYPQRSWSAIEAAAPPHLLADVRKVRRIAAADPAAANLKLIDARDALEYVRELPVDQPDLAWAAPDLWRTAYLHRWQQQFTGRLVGDTFVGRAAELHHRQLYDEDFPRRWRDYVLHRIGGGGEDAALAEARRQGVDFQRADWLTDDELATLDDRAARLTMLVRSARLDINLAEPDAATERLLGEHDVAAAVADCLRFNDVVAKQAYFKHIDHLKADKLRAHLIETWSLPADCDTRTLDVAARDRGFPAASAAIDASRPFFLRRYHPDAAA